MAEIEAVLFDLDGTLVDTAPDMVNALNALLQQEGRQPLPYGRVRNHVSKGASALIRLGFGQTIDDATRLGLLERFLALYSENLCVESGLFTGMAEALAGFEQQGTVWGVVTNKPGWLTGPLLQQLGLLQRAGCVISGDSLDKKKPDPAPLLHACDTIGVIAENTVYIGDDERDIVAGKAAGMHTLVASYGYINSDEDPLSWGADGMLHSAAELQHWLANGFTGGAQ